MERSASSWMDRLARKPAYILPDWRVTTARISEIGGLLLPHISGMNGLLSETSRSSKSPKNAIVVNVCFVPYLKTNQWRAPCPTDGCTKPSAWGPVFLHEECIALN